MSATDPLTVVITGASSGIGAEAARQLAARGTRLALAARREAELAVVAADCRARGAPAVFTHVCDLANPVENDRFCEALLAALPRIDVLVNNAGRSIRRALLDATDRPHDFERTIQLNYLAPVRTTLRLLPRLRDQGHGQIINISSVAALMTTPRFAAYLASKSALDAFTRSLRIELAEHGITATSLHYPLVKTDMIAPTAIYRYLPRLEVEEAAGWILRAIDRRPARMAPASAVAFLLATAALPGPALRGLAGFYRRRLAKAQAQLAAETGPP